MADGGHGVRQGDPLDGAAGEGMAADTDGTLRQDHIVGTPAGVADQLQTAIGCDAIQRTIDDLDRIADGEVEDFGGGLVVSLCRITSELCGEGVAKRFWSARSFYRKRGYGIAFI
jgi:hypothetical protein